MTIRTNFGGYMVLSTPMTAGLKSALFGSTLNRLVSLYDRPEGRPVLYPEFDHMHPQSRVQLLNEINALKDAVTDTATA